jgi:demethylmenaquinone methyltransferase/2-methoxy-6-polyprenyl-1,4-benzoquinol methylase
MTGDRFTGGGGAMRDYYDRRAAEYDSWWLGTGLFADRDRPGWEADREALRAVVASLPPLRVLDVACGTGYLTLSLAGEVTALDQAPRMVEITRGRVPGARVVQGEGIPLPFEDGSFDCVFTSHFYGHLQPDERAAFLSEVWRFAGELVVVDSALRPGGVAEDWQERVLDDGSRHSVYKRWFTGAGLADEIGGASVLHDGPWFVAVRSSSRRS